MNHKSLLALTTALALSTFAATHPAAHASAPSPLAGERTRNVPRTVPAFTADHLTG